MLKTLISALNKSLDEEYLIERYTVSKAKRVIDNIVKRNSQKTFRDKKMQERVDNIIDLIRKANFDVDVDVSDSIFKEPSGETHIIKEYALTISFKDKKKKEQHLKYVLTVTGLGEKGYPFSEYEISGYFV